MWFPALLFTAAATLAASPYPVPGQACKLPAPQAASLAPAIRKFPIKLVLDTTFTPDETNSIVAAAKTWNVFSHYSLGFDFFDLNDIQRGNFPNYRGSETYCAQKYQDRYDGLAFIRVPDVKTWNKFKENPNSTGVTTRCAYGLGPFPVQLAIALHQGRPIEKLLQSLVTHELGHALGLHHSCELDKNSGSYGKGTVICGDDNMTKDMANAIMYPDFNVRQFRTSGMITREIGTPKEELGSNDMERAYCLYRSLAQPK